MEWITAETKPGYYYTFLSETGEKYIALEGLDPYMIHEPYGIEAFIMHYFEPILLAYWGLIIATFVYLIGTYLIIPFYIRIKRGLPFFAEQ